MKKFIIIALVTGTFLGIVIVDTMADYSSIGSTQYSDRSISTDINVLNDSSDKTNDISVIDSKGGNRSVPLGMLMVGLTLVGLAGFREGAG